MFHVLKFTRKRILILVQSRPCCLFTFVIGIVLPSLVAGQQFNDPFEKLSSCMGSGHNQVEMRSNLGRHVEENQFEFARQGNDWSCVYEWKNVAYPDRGSKRFVFSRGGRGGDLVFGNFNSKNELFIASVSPTLLGDSKQSLRFWPFGSKVNGVFFGELWGVKIYDDLIQHAENNAVLDNGRLSLKGESDQGEFEVTIDPEHGNLPIEASIIKWPRHRIRGEFVKDFVDRQGRGDSTPTVYTMDHIEIRLQVNEFGKTGGVDYIKEWTINSKTYFKNSEVVLTQTYSGSLDDLRLVGDLAPKQMLLGVDIPIGTPVNVEGAQQIKCVWNGTWAEPMTKNFVNWTPPKEGGNWTRWTIVLAVIAMLLILGMVWRRSYKNG